MNRYQLILNRIRQMYRDLNTMGDDRVVHQMGGTVIRVRKVRLTRAKRGRPRERITIARKAEWQRRYIEVDSPEQVAEYIIVHGGLWAWEEEALKRSYYKPKADNEQEYTEAVHNAFVDAGFEDVFVVLAPWEEACKVNQSVGTFYKAQMPSFMQRDLNCYHARFSLGGHERQVIVTYDRAVVERRMNLCGLYVRAYERACKIKQSIPRPT